MLRVHGVSQRRWEREQMDHTAPMKCHCDEEIPAKRGVRVLDRRKYPPREIRAMGTSTLVHHFQDMS